jgi:hypothetical protein
MSTDPRVPPPNPYRAPQQPPYPTSYYAPPATGQFPTFSKVMLIIDLVLSLLRVPLVVFGVVAIDTLEQVDDPILATVVYEVATGAAMAFFGILADSAMLAKQRWGAMVGYLAVTATLANTAVGIWQLTININHLADPAVRIASVIGGGFTVLVRLGILALYTLAILKFTAWYDQYGPGADQRDLTVI